LPNCEELVVRTGQESPAKLDLIFGSFELIYVLYRYRKNSLLEAVGLNFDDFHYITTLLCWSCYWINALLTSQWPILPLPEIYKSTAEDTLLNIDGGDAIHKISELSRRVSTEEYQATASSEISGDYSTVDSKHDVAMYKMIHRYSTR